MRVRVEVLAWLVRVGVLAWLVGLGALAWLVEVGVLAWLVLAGILARLIGSRHLALLRVLPILLAILRRIHFSGGHCVNIHLVVFLLGFCRGQIVCHHCNFIDLHAFFRFFYLLLLWGFFLVSTSGGLVQDSFCCEVLFFV